VTTKSAGSPSDDVADTERKEPTSRASASQ
jgi:hypothetical protein